MKKLYFIAFVLLLGMNSYGQSVSYNSDDLSCYNSGPYALPKSGTIGSRNTFSNGTISVLYQTSRSRWEIGVGNFVGANRFFYNNSQSTPNPPTTGWISDAFCNLLRFVISGTPTSFAVTGTGAYCTGGIGVAVGLANSETGVTYQLKNGAANIGPSVNGTGSAISFGYQTTAATYTVDATKTVDGSTATMTGSAVVTMNTSPTVTITANNTTVCAGTSVSLAVTDAPQGQSLTTSSAASGSYVSVPNTLPTALLANTGFTVETWIYPTSFDSWARVFDFGEAAGKDNVLLAFTEGSSGNPTFAVYNNTAGSNNIISNTALSLNTWSHLAVTYDITLKQAIIYINGTEVANDFTINGPNISATRTKNYLGYSAWGDKSNARFDEMRFWNTVLSVSTINSYKNKVFNASHPNAANLLARYTFEGNANDATTHNYHGTAVNSPTYGTATTFNWSNSLGTAATATATPSASTTYSVSVTNTNGCANTGSQSITVGGAVASPITTNNALSFDGANDAVQITSCTNTDPIASKSALTIEYWFKGSSLQSAVRLQDASNNYVIAGWSNTHILSNDGGAGNGIAVGATATNGAWHHVAMTWQQNTTNGFKSYLDGNLVAQRNSSNTPIPTINANMYLGSFNGATEFMNGTIDEVRVWSVVRTQAQLQANANSCSFTTPQTGLQLYFKFNHGTGSGSNAGITGLANSATTDFTGAAQGFALTGSSSNWVAGTCIALPVELLSFGGKNTEGGNVLTWATATELSFSHFDIERSNDGKMFEKIGETRAKGSNSTYQFLDQTFRRFETFGRLYYRLKINDFDGKTDYSKTIAIESPTILRGVKIYPNPVSTTLNIQTENKGYFQILNLLGQQVLRGQTAQAIDVSALPQGTYILKVGEEQTKFMKQ